MDQIESTPSFGPTFAPLQLAWFACPRRVTRFRWPVVDVATVLIGNLPPVLPYWIFIFIGCPDISSAICSIFIFDVLTILYNSSLIFLVLRGLNPHFQMKQTNKKHQKPSKFMKHLQNNIQTSSKIIKIRFQLSSRLL